MSARSRMGLLAGIWLACVLSVLLSVEAVRMDEVRHLLGAWVWLMVACILFAIRATEQETRA